MQKNDSEVLLKAINTALLEKKAEHIINLDLTKIENAISKYFVIVTANSKIHANALAAFVEDFVRDNLREKPWQKEGFENSEWILLDYVDIVVHIFQDDIRAFYRLEQLWSDAKEIKL